MSLDSFVLADFDIDYDFNTKSTKPLAVTPSSTFAMSKLRSPGFKILIIWTAGTAGLARCCAYLAYRMLITAN